MKFTSTEIAGKGHIRTVFALGKEEMKLMLGMIKNAIKYTPHTDETTATRARLRNMCQTISKAIDET